MRKQRHGGSEHIHFSKQHEIAFAHHFLNMHRASEIRGNNISNFVVPEMQRRLNGQYDTSFTFDSIRVKYYTLRELTKLYIAFKRRRTGLGWDSQKFTFLINDNKWAEMEQVNPKFVKFQNDYSVYYLLEEVFVNQGATGDFSSDFENDPRTSAEEQDMEIVARCAREKGRLDYADADTDVEVVGGKEEKGKNGKGKRKSGDCSSGSPMSTASGSVTDRYLRALDTIESLVSRNKSSSMSMSVSSLTKHRSSRDGSKKSNYDVAMEQLQGLKSMAYVPKMAAAEILKDPQELAIWNLLDQTPTASPL